MSDLPLETRRALARAELQVNLVSAQGVIDKMMTQLKREGVAPSTIRECLGAAGAQLEHDVRQMESKLSPDSGTTQEKAIVVSHPLQETLLLNQIGAEPLCYQRLKVEDRYYDKFTVLRERKDGTKAEDTVWFDITKEYEKFARLQHRRAEAKDTPAGPTACFSCQKPAEGSRMWRCAACKSAWYCSKECRKNHWHNGHKKICKGLKARQDQLIAAINIMEVQEDQQRAISAQA